MDEQLKEILTAEEVAVILKMHLKTVYKFANKGLIPCKRIGGMWRFRRSEIMKMFDDKGT